MTYTIWDRMLAHTVYEIIEILRGVSANSPHQDYGFYSNSWFASDLHFWSQTCTLNF